jgi:methyl-accepting chemotaxis protein
MFKKLSMNVKQAGSYIVIVIFLIVITNISYNNVLHLRDQTLHIGQKNVPMIVATGDLKEQFTRISFMTMKHAFERNEAEKNNIENFINDEIVKINNSLKELEDRKLNKSEKSLMEDFAKKYKEYVEVLPAFFEVSNSNDYNLIDNQIEKIDQLGINTVVSVEKLYENAQKDADVTIQESLEDSNKFNYQILFLSVAASLFSVLIAFLMTKMINRLVSRVVKNVDITTNSVGEIEKSIELTSKSARELDTSMNKANNSVRELVTSINQVAGNTNITASGVDEVSAAVEQMSATINLVSKSADQLNVSAEETSSAIQEMMASIELVAGNAGNVGASVEQISAAIEEMSKSIKGVSENAVNLTHTSEQTSATVEEMVASIKQALQVHKL